MNRVGTKIDLLGRPIAARNHNYNYKHNLIPAGSKQPSASKPLAGGYGQQRQVRPVHFAANTPVPIPPSPLQHANPVHVMPQPKAITASEPMAWGDAYWLRLPGDNLITWILQGQGSLSQQQLRLFVQHQLLPLPRFTQRPMLRCPGRWEWQQLPQVDLQHHVQATKLAWGSSEQQRNAIWTSWAEQPMAYDRPLWDMLLVQEKKRFAIVFRVHHALCDGKGMMEILLQVQPNRIAAANMWSMVHAQSRFKHVAYQAWHQSILWWSDVVFSPVPHPLRLATPMAQRKFAYLAKPWPLAQLKAMAKQSGGGTVNDVALTLLAAALTKALQQQGQPVSQQVQVLIPLLRPEQPQDVWWPHNSVTSGVCQIPLGDLAWQERYDAVRSSTSGLKSDIIPSIMEHATSLLVSLPPDWIAVMVQQLTNQLTCIVSNVRGLPEPIEFADKPIDRMVWFGPKFGTIGLHVPMISYKGALEVGIVLEERLTLQPEYLCDLLQQEYQLARMALLQRSERSKSANPLRGTNISWLPPCIGRRSPVDGPTK